MSAEQLTFWKDEITHEGMMWLELADLKTKQNNLRRGLFQRFDELQKELELLRNQLVLLTTQKKD
jgi:hypothetical protein